MVQGASPHRARGVRQSAARLVGHFRKVVEPTRESTEGEIADWFDAKQSEPDMTPTAKKRNSPEETPKVKAKAKAKTKGLVESIDAELNKKLVAA